MSAAMQRLTSTSTAEVRGYWEVPGLAHFCSLFRGMFGLVDFDIEDLEEALSIDASSRHSLVVDLLVALIKGSVRHPKDVTMLTYNQCLWDLLNGAWVGEQREFGDAEAKNPLGRSRSRANFHALPVYAKLKLLHWLCELRLSRPDVDGLTKNLEGDSLRVSELGRDDSGATYWYFYGTRLYKEDAAPQDLTLRIPLSATLRAEEERAAGKGRGKGRRAAKAKPPPARGKRKRRLSSDEEDESEESDPSEDDEPELPPPPSPPAARKTPRRGAAKTPKTPASSNARPKTAKTPAEPPAKKVAVASSNGDEASPLPSRRSLRQAVKRGFPEVGELEDEASSRDSLPATPAPPRHKHAAKLRVQAKTRDTPQSSTAPSDDEASNQGPPQVPKLALGNRTMMSMIDRIYSRDDDDVTDDDEDLEEAKDKANADPEPETPEAEPKSEEPSEEPKSAFEEPRADAKPEADGEETPPAKEEAKDEPMETEESGAVAKSVSETKAEGNAPEASGSSDTVILDKADEEGEPKEAKETKSEDGSTMELKEESSAKEETEEEGEEDPHPWDQPALRPDPKATKRWHLVCTTLEDWAELVSSLKGRSRAEKELAKHLREDFLPDMETLFLNKEKERQRKEAELSRRTSERVELRKLQEEAEKEKLQKREEEEMSRLEELEAARRRKAEAEEREQRRKQREKDRDKHVKLRERTKEDRSRRLELRQQRQELIRLGQPVPDEMMPHGQLGDEDDEREEEMDEVYGQLEKVVDALKKHPDCEPFVEPVTEELAPDYVEKIEKPMCLETIEDKLFERAYTSKVGFVEDVNLIFTNCLLYNGRDSEYTRLAQSLERGFLRAFHKYFPRPADFGDEPTRQQRELELCVDKLGALDKELNKELYAQRERAKEEARKNKRPREAVQDWIRRFLNKTGRSISFIQEALREKITGEEREERSEEFETPPSSPLVAELSSSSQLPSSPVEEGSLAGLFRSPEARCPLPDSPAPRASQPSRPPLPTVPPPALSLLCANVNGARGGAPAVQGLLNSTDPPPLAILLQETKVPREDPFPSLVGFTAVHKGRPGRSGDHGGGVAVVVRDALAGSSFTLRPVCDAAEELEAVAVRLDHPLLPSAVVLASVYRPPGLSQARASAFVEDLSDWLSDIVVRGDSVILGGDVNAELWGEEGAELRAALESLGLKSVGSLTPTRQQRNIDWLWASEKLLSSQPGYEAPSPSSRLLPPLEKEADGHAVLCWSLPLRLRPVKPLPKPGRRRVRRWGLLDVAAAAQSLAAHPPLPRDASPDRLVEELDRRIWEAVQEAVPVVEVSDRAREEQPEWLDGLCRDLVRREREAWEKWTSVCRKPSHPDVRNAAWSRYKSLHKRKRGQIKAAKRTHILQVIEDCRGSGRLWEVWRRLSGKQKKRLTLRIDGEWVEEPEEVGAALAAHFRTLYDSQPPPILAELPLPPELDPASPPLPVPKDALLSPDDAARLLKTIKARKAAGGDGLSGLFAKECREELASPIAAAVSSAILHQSFPSSWKTHVKIVPVPKTSKPSSPSGFRNIAVLGVVPKLAERWMKELLDRFLPWPGVGHLRQFGFCRNSSTADALLFAQQRVSELAAGFRRGTPGGLRIAVVSIDVAAAFDRCPHASILHTLDEQGCPLWLLRLVADWLRGRSLQVHLEGEARGEAFPATSGTPQGGSCSPYFYASVVRGALDLPFSEGTSMQLYADDSVMIKRLDSEAEQKELEEDVELYLTYLKLYGLRVNAAKSKVLVVSPSTPASQEQRLFRPFAIAGDAGPEVVSEVKSLRMLGIDWDRSMSFAGQWSRLRTSARAGIAAIGRLVEFEPGALRSLVRSRLLPLLSYSILPSPPRNKTTWAELERMVRYVSRRVVKEELPHRELLLRAGMQSAAELAAGAHLRFARACVMAGRRWGQFVERGPLPVPVRRPGLRPRQGPQLLPSARALLLRPLPSHSYTRLQGLGPHVIIATWNRFVELCGEFGPSVIRSDACFDVWASIFASNLDMAELTALDWRKRAALAAASRPPRGGYTLAPRPPTPSSASRTQPYAPRATGARVYGSNAAYRVPPGSSPRLASPAGVRVGPASRVVSSYTPPGRGTTTIRPSLPPGAKPSVYLLPAPDGENRLLKFVTKDGQPAPNDLVQRLLPQLKKEAHKLPKGFLTLTIDSQDAPEDTAGTSVAKAPAAEGPPPKPAPKAPTGAFQGAAQSSHVASTSSAPPPQSAGTSASPATAAPSAKPERFYHIGENTYLAIENGNPFLYKKTPDGRLVKSQQVSRDGLLEKLKKIQATKQALPVCSVAPTPSGASPSTATATSGLISPSVVAGAAQLMSSMNAAQLPPPALEKSPVPILPAPPAFPAHRQPIRPAPPVQPKLEPQAASHGQPTPGPYMAQAAGLAVPTGTFVQVLNPPSATGDVGVSHTETVGGAAEAAPIPHMVPLAGGTAGYATETMGAAPMGVCEPSLEAHFGAPVEHCDPSTGLPYGGGGMAQEEVVSSAPQPQPLEEPEIDINEFFVPA